MDWLALLGAFGLGSVLTSLVQSWLANRTRNEERRFQERKEAYIGLLEAWRDDDISGNLTQNAFNIGHWVLRCELVGSNQIRKALTEWQTSEPGSEQRVLATRKVKRTMQSDLC